MRGWRWGRRRGCSSFTTTIVRWPTLPSICFYFIHGWRGRSVSVSVCSVYMYI